MRKIVFYLLCCLFFSAYSQDRLFLSIGDSEVTIDDFMKNYYKNRLETDTLGFEDSLTEYLDLYIKFKLKVLEAQQLGLDTTPSFLRELDGYRQQLVKPYLTDRDVSEELLKEAYDRLKYEVSASHILIKVNPNDTIIAYNKVLDIKNQLDAGATFIDLAKQLSDDPSVKDNQGNLGYFSALYMVYPFESAAYNTPIGQISNPVKTRFGYHILKINDKRLSRGEVKVAHILIKKNKKQSDSTVKNKINELYDSLRLGVDFAQLAKSFSDDKKSAQLGGELDWFGTNKMVKSFEEVAFSLDSLDSISEPFETDFGWHIVKLLDIKKLPLFEDIKESLIKRVERDSRSQRTRNVVLNRLKNEWGFSENLFAKKIFYKLINEDFINNNSDITQRIENQGHIMFVFNNEYDVSQRYVYQKDFANFLISFRSRLNKKVDYKSIVDELYKTFKEQKILEIESNNLEFKYDEFRLLYDEYHDGILMYKLQKEKVWDKAISDTLGLSDFHMKNKLNYMWPNRVSVKIYNSKDQKINNKVYRNLKSNMGPEKLLEKINKTSSLNLSIEESIFSKGENIFIDHFIFNQEWNSLKKNDIIFCEQENKIIQIIDLLSETPKLLTDIKGVVISDYQSFLEKEWIDSLRDKYKVVINQNIFELAKRQAITILAIDNSLSIPSDNSFKFIFSNTVQKLGASKDVYFGWNNMIYNTHIKPSDEE